MVQHYFHGLSISANQHLPMIRVLTGNGFVKIEVPWQQCLTIGPLPLQRQEITNWKLQNYSGPAFETILWHLLADNIFCRSEFIY